MTSYKGADDEHPYRELGRFLEELRLAKGWSLRKAAQMIGGISHSRLHDFERGQDPHSAIPTKPTEDQLMRLAKVYQVDVGALLRLAGYSAVGPLAEWEEELIIQARKLPPVGRESLRQYLSELVAQSRP